MARQVIDIGLQGNDGTGDSIRESFRKVNENFRDLYAVFGRGGQIAFTDLDDAPGTYSAGQIFITDNNGAAIEARTLLAGSGITINTNEVGELTIALSNGGLADAAPQLIGPLRGNGLPIANVAVPSLDAVANWNIAHEGSGISINIDDIVITKGYADTRYVLGGTGVPMRVREEPANVGEYTYTISSYSASGNAVILAHGLTSSFNGFKVTYNTSGVAPTGLVSGDPYYVRYVNDNELSLHPTLDDAKNNTAKIIVTMQGSGAQTLTDFYYNPALSGNWLSNEALPRNQIVRRAGDTMTGFLNLHSSPTANLHAATKQYVDTTSVASAKSTISVANDGTAAGSASISYDANTGVITFHNSMVSVDTSEPQGFVNRVDSVISFNSVTLTFKIEPAVVGGSYVVWTKGVRRVYNTAQTVQIPDVTGLNYIYYNTAGVLSVKQSEYDFEFDSPVSYLYWNATAGTAPFVADERHGTAMSWAIHEYLHRTRGAVFASGFAATYTLGDGTSNGDAHMGITSGTFFDEDLECNITHSVSPIPNTFQQILQGPGRFPIMKLSGPGEWLIDPPTDFPMKQGLAGNGPEYNRFNMTDSTGYWDTISLANGKFGVSWLIATNNISYPVFAILGQDEYDTLGEAEADTWAEQTLTHFPVFEYRPLYKIIYESNSGYANNIKAKIVEVWDLRGITSTTISATQLADHGLLSGLLDDDHEQYVHLSNARIIPANHSFTGNITFSGTVNLPNSGVAAGTYTKLTVNEDGLVSNATTATTSDITEGTNLYFTDERVDDRVSSLIQGGSNITVTYDDLANTLTISAATTGSGYDLSGNTTSDLAEGTNLYFTDARARTAISVSGDLSYDNLTGVISYSHPSTTNVAEGTNLYFTDARARTAISVSGDLSYDNLTGVISYTTPATISSLSNHTTDDLAEGTTHLYYTAGRVRQALSSGTGISYNNVSGAISSTITQYTDAMARSAVSGDFGITYSDTTGVISVSGSASATASSVTLRDSSGDLYANKFHGAVIYSVQDLSPDSSGIVLDTSTLTGNLLTCNPQDAAAYIQLPLGTPQGPINPTGYRLLVRNRHSTNPMELRDGANAVIAQILAQSSVEIACDGYNWFVI